MLRDRNQDKPAFVLLALNLDNETLEQMAFKSFGISSYKAVEGSYKGEKERSYVVPFKTVNQLQELLRLARHYKQESVLMVDSSRNTELIYLDVAFQEVTPLGKFQNVSKFEAEASDSYTYDPSTNYYYLAKAV